MIEFITTHIIVIAALIIILIILDWHHNTLRQQLYLEFDDMKLKRSENHAHLSQKITVLMIRLNHLEGQLEYLVNKSKV